MIRNKIGIIRSGLGEYLGYNTRNYGSTSFKYSVDSNGNLHSYNFEPVEDEFDPEKTYWIHGEQVTQEYVELLKNRTEILGEL